MEITCIEHQGAPKRDLRVLKSNPASLQEMFPNLAGTAEDLLCIVLEMLAYEREQKGGMYALCQMADQALEKAKGNTDAALSDSYRKNIRIRESLTLQRETFRRDAEQG